MTYLVEQGTGYAVHTAHGTEIHQCETLDLGWCCDRGCAIRHMRTLGVPIEVVTEHPLGHGAGEFIDLRETDARTGDAPIVSWGAWPCADSPLHEYCPACGALTIHGSEDGDEYPGRSCDGWNCSWPQYRKE